MSLVDLPSVYGRLIGAHHVEEACVVLLGTWLDEYLAHVERISGEDVNSITRPRSVRVSSELDAMPEDQTPALIVRSPGLLGVPEDRGHGQYTASYELEVGLHVSAKGVLEYGSPRALRLARMYALAIRAVLVQQSDKENGVLFRRDWIGEGYDTLPPIDDRTICLSRVRFSIEVPGVVQRWEGPTVPSEPLYPTEAPEWPEALSADVETRKVPIPEDMT